MKYSSFILFLMLSTFLSNAQKDSTLLFERSKGALNYPFSNFSSGSIMSRDTSNFLFICAPNPGITFMTDRPDSVLAVYDGQVCFVSNVDLAHIIIVRFGRYFVTYSGLNVPLFAVGDKVKAEQIIGTVFQDDNGRGRIDLMIAKESKLLDTDVWLKH
jgi:murein DD-endopeptidase MepM/ murein hydrolase activator NlpD